MTNNGNTKPAEYYHENGDGPFPKHFDDCDHTDIEIEIADPSVGLFYEGVWCNSCGAVATEHDSDVVLDEEGLPHQVGTGGPIWDTAPRYRQP